MIWVCNKNLENKAGPSYTFKTLRLAKKDRFESSGAETMCGSVPYIDARNSNASKSSLWKQDLLSISRAFCMHSSRSRHARASMSSFTCFLQSAFSLAGLSMWLRAFLSTRRLRRSSDRKNPSNLRRDHRSFALQHLAICLDLFPVDP